MIIAASVLRVWLALSLLQLPSGMSPTATTFASLEAVGLLPLGPAAPAAGTLASAGAGNVAHGLAAGLVVSVSTLLAVGIYAIALLRLRALGMLAAGRPAAQPAAALDPARSASLALEPGRSAAAVIPAEAA